MNTMDAAEHLAFASREWDLLPPSDPDRVKRHLDVAETMPARPRCPVCGVTGYRRALVTPGMDTIFWCRKGHPHYSPHDNKR